MTVQEIRDIANEQMMDALRKAQEKKEISGVAFTLTFKKTPALETKAVFSLEKGTVIRDGEAK